jgi:hypothetical protein
MQRLCGYNGKNQGECGNMARTVDATDFIKPYVEPAPEEKVAAAAGLSPFDFIKSVSNSKKDLMKEDPDNAKAYTAYVVNHGLSFFPDTVLLANEMNMYPDIPAVSQYYYYMGSIRKGNRFSQWHKAKKNEDLDLVQKVYQVRRDIAKQYLKLISEDGLSKLRELTDTGEASTKKKTK